MNYVGWSYFSEMVNVAQMAQWKLEKIKMTTIQNSTVTCRYRGISSSVAHARSAWLATMTVAVINFTKTYIWNVLENLNFEELQKIVLKKYKRCSMFLQNYCCQRTAFLPIDILVIYSEKNGGQSVSFSCVMTARILTSDSSIAWHESDRCVRWRNKQ